MPSQFGGIPVERPEEAQQSQFGGVSLDTSEPVQVNIPEANSLALNNTIKPDTEDPAAKELLDESESQRQQMLDLARTRFPPEVVDSWEDNPIGFGEAGDFLKWSQILPGGGLVQGAAINIATISRKIENNETLTDSEQANIDEFINKQIEMTVRGMSYGGQYRYYGSQMPAFMVEFALTGGPAKAAQVATVQAITKGVAKSVMQKTIAKQTGRLARVATQSALMAPMAVAKYGEQRLGPWMVTDKGQIIFEESKDSPAMSALKAYAHVSAEVASELSGATIAKYAINPITKRLKTPLINGINALPEGLKLGLFEAYKKIKPNATISKAFTAGGWNGMLAELGEERVADVLRETVNLTLEDGYTFDQVLDGITPTTDQLLLEAGLIGTLGGAKAISNVATNILIDKGLTRKEAEEAVNNMTVTEQEAFAEAELKLESSIVQAEREIETGKMPPEIQNQVLESYDELKEGEVGTEYDAKEKSLAVLNKAKNKASKENTSLASLISGQTGINQDSYVMDKTGYDRGIEKEINDLEKSPKFGALIAEYGGLNQTLWFEEASLNNKESGSLPGGYQKPFWRSGNKGLAPDELAEKLYEDGYISSYDQKEAIDFVEDLLRSGDRFLDPEVEGSLAQLNKRFDELDKSLDVNVDKIYDELREVNKKARSTVFRKKGGMTIDEVAEALPEQFGAESNLDDVVQVIDQMVAQPELGAYPDKQAAVDAIQKEIEILEQTKNEELEAYYKGLPARQEVETGDLERISLNELEASLEQEYPTVTQQEFDDSMKLLDEYILLQEGLPLDNPVLESQTDAALDAEGINIDPNESIFNDFYYTWFDRFGALVDLSKEAVKRGAKLRPGDTTDYLIRQYYSVAGLAKQILTVNTNTINKSGQVEVTGKGLRSILDDFDNIIIRLEPNKKQRNQDLKDYLIARRYYYDLQQRSDVEVTEKQALDTAKTLDALALKYGDSLKWFDETAKEIHEFQKRVLQLAVDAGNMKPEVYAKIVESNQNYIPFQRVLDEEFGPYDSAGQGKIFTNATINRVIKKIVGSEREIKDPIESIIRNTFRIVDLASQNKVAQSISSLAGIMPEYIQPIGPLMETIKVDGKEVKRPSKEAPKGTITVFEGGKRKYYRVAKPILKAVEQMRPEQFNFVQKFFQAPASVLRAGATLIPEFWVRNVLRDMQSSFIQSEARPIAFVDPIRGLVALIGKTDLHNQWMQSGGSFNNYMELTDNGMARAQKELMSNDGKIARYLKNPLRLPEDISLTFEQAVRIGTFAAAKRKGMSDTEAAFESRDATLDFARGGSASKSINRYVPFFNAGMQGADKLYRSMRDNPKATTMWAVGTITMPSLILAGYYLYGAPDDERQEYSEIPQWQKDMFWIAKVDGEWVRYPKPFSLGYLFGSVPERFLSWGQSKGIKDVQDFWIQLVKGVAGSISPIYDPSAAIPPLVKVTIENVANYNFFQGRNVYPAWMEDLPPEDRKTRYGSRSAEEIGKVLGVSPAKVDNALRGTLAGSAQYVTDAGDYILNEVSRWNGEEIPARPTSRLDIPQIKAFAMRFPTGSSSESVNLFYRSSKLIRQAANKIDDLRGEERSKYREENIALVRSEKAFNSSTKNIRRLNKRRNLVFDNLVMTGKEKETELRRLDDLILDQARRANSVLESNIQNLQDE